MPRTRFIINEPGHKRWYLGDGVHVYNSVIFGAELNISVFPVNEPHNVKYSKRLNLFDEGWEEETVKTQREAERMFPAKRREFIVTSDAGGSIHLMFIGNELHHLNSLDGPAQRKHILHAAWRALWESEAQTMLRHLCTRFGVDEIKRSFENVAQVEER